MASRAPHSTKGQFIHAQFIVSGVSCKLFSEARKSLRDVGCFRQPLAKFDLPIDVLKKKEIRIEHFCLSSVIVVGARWRHASSNIWNSLSRSERIESTTMLIHFMKATALPRCFVSNEHVSSCCVANEDIFFREIARDDWIPRKVLKWE